MSFASIFRLLIWYYTYNEQALYVSLCLLSNSQASEFSLNLKPEPKIERINWQQIFLHGLHRYVERYNNQSFRTSSGVRVTAGSQFEKKNHEYGEEKC